MKHITKLGYIVIGAVLTLTLNLAIPTLAATTDAVVKQLTANFTSGGKPISIYVDGEKITPKDANGNIVEPFQVDGTTYLPVRAVAEALGKTVDWDGAAASVHIGNIVRTYDELVKAAANAKSGSGRSNIIIRGNITIPDDAMTFFQQCTITIDEGFNVTVNGVSGAGYNGDWASVINVKGTLAVGSSGTLCAVDSGIINVIGEGKITFEKNAKLELGAASEWGTGGQINGISGAPSKSGEYLWDGSKFVSATPLK